MKKIAFPVAALISLGCGSNREASTDVAAAPDAQTKAAATEAVVTLAAKSGSEAGGEIGIVPMGDGIHLTGTVSGLPGAGEFGFHIHEKGDCSAADASSAGGHFNPDGAAHGKREAGPHHAGDIDNLVSDGGVAKVDRHLSGLSLGDGGAHDVAGRALVVHAKPDDYTSQPTGDAGARIACGVIELKR